MINIMNKKVKTVLGILVVVIVTGGIGLYFYNDIDQSVGDEEKLDYIEESAETISFVNEISIAVPSLDRPIVFSVEMPDEARVIIKANIERLSYELKGNSDLFPNWIDLGLQRKMTGDYEGARDAWEYAGVIRPSSGLPFRNLGDLYGYYLNDTQKAEENLLKAIKNNPTQIEYYFKTAEFYGDVVLDVEKARVVVQQGIDVNPDFSELKELLNSL